MDPAVIGNPSGLALVSVFDRHCGGPKQVFALLQIEQLDQPAQGTSMGFESAVNQNILSGTCVGVF